jgi:chromosome segregation ATPase
MAKTPKQVNLEKAQAHVQTLHEQHAAANTRHNSYQDRLHQLEAQREQLEGEHATIVAAAVVSSTGAMSPRAAEVRGDISKTASEIEANNALRDASLARLQAMSAEHAPHHEALAEAEKLARREPCELLLEKLDESFRQVEAAWNTAALAAEFLFAEPNFDHWGKTVLDRTYPKLEQPWKGSDQLTLKLPKISDAPPSTS